MTDVTTIYLDDAFPPLRTHTVDWCCRKIRHLMKSRCVNTIVVRGMSGLLIGTIVAEKLKLGIACIRKPEKNHYGNTRNVLEGCYNVKNYVIIDDLVSTGATLRVIDNTINSDAIVNKQTRCVAVLLYSCSAGDYASLNVMNSLKKRSMFQKTKFIIRDS